MKIKEIIKKTWGFILAWMMFLTFSYFLVNYCNLTDWLYIIYAYILLLLLSIIIFHCICNFQIYIIPFIPIFPLVFYVSRSVSGDIKEYLNKKKINQDTHKSTVIIITHFNWYNLDYYINSPITLNSIKAIVEYLEKTKKVFSFYLKASRNDIENIMIDKKVNEVYFVGHGESDKFQINVESSIKYIEFNKKKYSKDYVHQIHCGSKKGVPLRYYVVPKSNWKLCYFRRETIREKIIVKYFINKKIK